MNIFFVFLMLANATTAPTYFFKVSSPKLNYTISISKDAFLYQSGSRKVQQKIQLCGARAYELFSKDLTKKIQRDRTKSTVKNPNSIEVTINHKKFYLEPRGKSAVYLSKIDSKVNSLAGEAAKRCSKK